MKRRRISTRWNNLENKRMAEKLSTKEALSVRDEGESCGDGFYILRRFVENVDYCDPDLEAWIWSIGRNRITGEIWASSTSQFYSANQDAEWECLFLR